MNEEKFMKIRLSSIHPSAAVPFDIFVHIGGKFIHYLRVGDFISAEKIKSFERRAPDVFFIYSSERLNYKKYVRERMLSDQLPSREKALILRESSLSMMEELFENPDVNKALNESKEIINEFISFMDQDPEAMGHLIGLSSHDFYTYNHSLDVGIYSLGLAKVTGIKGTDLHDMGQGALLHDIGKRHVNVDIICKSGPLDEVEWAQMQKHPQYGLSILDNYSVSDAVRACCFEHHESFLGNGYPQQLQGHEIHPMARIVAITDTYDALTTKRSYNAPMSPSAALNFMKEKLSTRYDADLLRAMFEVLFQMESVMPLAEAK
ncbi:MAG: HD domain-containing protein [Bdellovibrionales bacterium]|nr:HD domain-containing protein [Bdellovibrionales bacterium]